MRAHIVLLMALVAGGSAAEESGGLLQSISRGINTAGAAISSLYTTYETAPYNLQSTIRDEDNNVLYEQRVYLAQKWVCTTEIEDGAKAANKDAFMRLFAYITGANNGSHQIPMTTPVSMMRLPLTEEDLTRHHQGGRSLEASSEEEGESEEESGEEARRKYTMCFYINFANQENPPTPTNPEVFIESRPLMTVLANRDGGFMSEQDWQRQAEKLKEDSMARQEVGVDYSRYYRAGYDSPMKFWNRRNEIWYVKQVPDDFVSSLGQDE